VGSLGTFGAAEREYRTADQDDPDTFDLLGETFTVRGTIPAMVEIGVAAALSDKVSGVEGDALLFEALRYALSAPRRDENGHPMAADESEWQRFRAFAAERDVEAEWLTQILLNIMGAQVGRPTERRPGSSSGPLPTSTSSNSSASDSPASPG
jgi:hypothetical protein